MSIGIGIGKRLLQESTFYKNQEIFNSNYRRRLSDYFYGILMEINSGTEMDIIGPAYSISKPTTFETFGPNCEYTAQKE